MSEKSIKFTYIKLPKSVYAILFARIVNAMGNFVFPFMTLLLTTKIGMTEQQAGSFLLMGSMLQIPGALIGGKLCDITGRKKIMIIFMGLAALCYIPCAVLTECPDSFFYLPWLMIISIFFNSIARPASGAMVNDLTYPENRQAAFSLLYMGMNVGAAIGSLLAGFLFQKYMKLLFLGDMVTTIIAVLIMMIFVKETKPSKEEWVIVEQSECNDEKAEAGGMLAALLHRPRLLIFALFDTIFSFIYAQTSFSLPLQVNAIFGETQGARYYGTFNMINCMEVIFFTTIITIVTKKVKTLYNVSMAGIFYAIGFGMLFFANQFWMFVVSTIIWTVGEIINATNVGVYIANHTPMSHRGRFNSIISIITGSGGALSPYIMGGYIQQFGVNNVWSIIFLLGMSASILMFILGKTEK